LGFPFFAVGVNRKQRRYESKRNRSIAPMTVADDNPSGGGTASEPSRDRAVRNEELLDGGASAEPDGAEALLRLGTIAWQSGEKGKARELYRRSAELNSPNPNVHNDLGNALAEAGLPDLARREYERALAIEPDGALFHYNFGNLLRILGDHESAVRAYERALSLDSGYADAHAALGNVLAALDRPDEAMNQWRAAIAARPSDAEPYNNLGSVLNGLGRFDEALVNLEKAIALNPSYAHAQNNLGNAYLGCGRIDDSIVRYRAALAIEPDYVNALINLGNALCRLNRAEEARGILERALTLAPNSAPVDNALGNALQKLGRLEEAVVRYDRAIAIQPNYSDAWTNLAAAYNELGRYADALNCSDRAFALGPENAAAHVNRGNALMGLDQFDEAMKSYRRALAIDPAVADAYGNIGSALVEGGSLEEAIRCFDQAIALEPKRPKFLLSHVLVKPVTAEDPRLAMLESLAREAAAMPDAARVELHFGLAKAYADIGRHDASFTELTLGNALKRKDVDYNEAATLAGLDHYAAAWTEEVIRDWKGIGDPSDKPIFILGMPRSGSTLIEQMVASHPAVRAGGETNALRDAAADVFGRLEEFFPASEPASRRAAAMADIARKYLAAMERRAPGARRITDKMPSNFALIGLIPAALPNARIVHTRRNPLDTCLSCFANLFTDVQFSYDLAETGRYYRAYERLMRHWHRVLPESAILDVDYEVFVSDFENQSKRILDHCGLPWDDACLSFHTAKSRVKTASAVQVRRPIYRSSVGRWRAIDPALLAPLRAALGEFDRGEG
jgi:tetratricopeptide (TPR) repeat protein